MTNINSQAAIAREDSRENSGKFGEQHHTAPEIVLGATPVVAVTGAPTTVVFIPDGNGYEAFSVAAARTKLGIPDTEPEDVVLDTIRLLAEGEEYPPYFLENPGYAEPGDDGVISTSEWVSPIGDISWEEHADAWQSDGEETVHVRARAVLDPEEWGWGDSRAAFGALIESNAADTAEWSQWGDGVHIHEGKVVLPIADTFQPGEFEPRIVADRLSAQLAEVNPFTALAEVKDSGVVISDANLEAAKSINGRAAAYAVANGRTPSDADIVAVSRDFNVRTTLGDGYLEPFWRAGTVKEGDPAALTALIAWEQNRKKV